MSGSIGQFLGPLSEFLGMIEGVGGGELSAMLVQLENGGLAETVRSWVGHDENKPVTAEELGQAFTPEQLNDWAAKAGTTPEALLEQMAKELPDTVQQAKADGRLPNA